MAVDNLLVSLEVLIGEDNTGESHRQKYLIIPERTCRALFSFRAIRLSPGGILDPQEYAFIFDRQLSDLLKFGQTFHVQLTPIVDYVEE